MVKTVLVVDDDQDFLLQEKIQLEAQGYKVLTAETVQEAKDRLAECEPDVALVDLMLDQMDGGFALCHFIKKQNPKIPVIMISAVRSETGLDFGASTEEERAWVKADCFLAKPVRFEQLIGEIERLVED